jgi:hypothetical protein
MRAARYFVLAIEWRLRPGPGLSGSDPSRRAIRPVKASKASIRNGCFYVDLRRSVFDDEQQLQVDLARSPSRRCMTAICAFLPLDRDRRRGRNPALLRHRLSVTKRLI